MEQPELPPAEMPGSPQAGSGFRSKLIVAAVILAVLGGSALGYLSLRKSAPRSSTKNDSEVPIASSSHYVGNSAITLRDVRGGTLSATVTRTITEDRVLMTAKALLPVTPEGAFYHLWLEKPDRNLSVGGLVGAPDGTFALENSSSLDSSETFAFDSLYNTVVISLETIDDNVIETRLLEGSFSR